MITGNITEQGAKKMTLLLLLDLKRARSESLRKPHVFLQEVVIKMQIGLCIFILRVSYQIFELQMY